MTSGHRVDVEQRGSPTGLRVRKASARTARMSAQPAPTKARGDIIGRLQASHKERMVVYRHAFELELGGVRFHRLGALSDGAFPNHVRSEASA
jgi:hypothetical protein